MTILREKMIYRIVSIIFLSCFLLVSCQSNQKWLLKKILDQPEPGLVRTNFYHLKRKTYVSLGFSLEIPVQGVNRKNKYHENVYDSYVYRKNAHVLGELV